MENVHKEQPQDIAFISVKAVVSAILSYLITQGHLFPDSTVSSVIMRVSSLCFALPVLAVSVAGNGGGSSEYYSLGCPSSTMPQASQKQQVDAITDYGNLLYLQKQIETAENTYVAKQFINHAPEVPGNGTDLAIKTLTPMLATSTIEIQRVFVGSSADGSDYSVTYFKGISSVQGVGVIADIWRMIGTCLVEHWDVAAGVQNSSNPIAYF